MRKGAETSAAPDLAVPASLLLMTGLLAAAAAAAAALLAPPVGVRSMLGRLRAKDMIHLPLLYRTLKG